MTLSENMICSNDKICPRCERYIEDHEIAGTIDGEPAHRQCILDELDEYGMDDFHNDG